LRAQTTFGFTWALLGNATADHVAIRQLAALGGVWLLSALVVLVNAQAMSLLQMARTRHRRWGAIGLSLGCVGLAVSYGMFMDLAPRAPRKDAREPVPVAAIQHTRATYHLEDFLPIGLDRRYPHAIQEALAQRTQLIVLPESIALGAMRLDATHSPSKPPDRQTTRSAWDRELQAILRGTAAVVVIGLDTVEAGHDHNTLVAWTREGSIGWYHKQGLVPFSEYVPSGWNLMAIRGRSQYSPGHGSQLIRLNEGLVLGGFICQEVLLPGFVRRSVRDGATVLVSGGNDGVFANPAVARVHADAAQLRAVETGRFLVRAMKTGISAVIDPRGRELVRSQSAEPALLLSAITPLDNLTPYVRFGDWVLWLAALLAGGALLFSPLPPAKRK